MKGLGAVVDLGSVLGPVGLALAADVGPVVGAFVAALLVAMLRGFITAMREHTKVMEDDSVRVELVHIVATGDVRWSLYGAEGLLAHGVEANEPAAWAAAHAAGGE